MPPSSGGARTPDTGITPGDEHEIETMERRTSGSGRGFTAPRGIGQSEHGARPATSRGRYGYAPGYRRGYRGGGWGYYRRPYYGPRAGYYLGGSYYGGGLYGRPWGYPYSNGYLPGYGAFFGSSYYGSGYGYSSYGGFCR
jgi:hypothetical protein